MLVSVLNWLRLRRPSVAPKRAVLGVYSNEQREVLGRLVRLTESWDDILVDIPSDLGRSATKFRGVDDHLQRLETFAQLNHIGLDPYSSRRQSGNRDRPYPVFPPESGVSVCCVVF